MQHFVFSRKCQTLNVLHVIPLSPSFVVAFVRGIFPGAEEPGRQDLEGIAIHSLRTRYPGHHAGSQVTDSAEIRRHQHAVILSLK